MRTLFERSVLAGIGVLSMTHEKAQKIVDELIRRGEVQKDEAKDWVDSLVQRGDEEHQSLRKLIRDKVKSTLDEFGLGDKTRAPGLGFKNGGSKQTREGIRITNFLHAHFLFNLASLLISTYTYL